MKLLCASIVLAVCVACQAGPSLHELLQGKEAGSIWALIVAGSNTWMNYRHQADVCHAYQIFHTYQVPDDHIVVMMYDDIAENEANPGKGVIINHLNGPNVYPGVPHDYTKETVTPSNFLKILKGENMNGTGSGKTINSGPNDYVFVNFVDHGAPGIVAFPDGELHAKEWNTVINEMYQNKQFKQMVIYVEACESGSIFNNILPDNINVYATTAANPDESSYACYYDSKLGTYVGDCYSVNWMENVDKVGTMETLETQYKIVKQETTTSHVMQYGDLSIAEETLAVFMGSKSNGQPLQTPLLEVAKDAVPSGDVPLSVLAHKVFQTPHAWDKAVYEEQLMEELMVRDKVRQAVKRVVSAVVSPDQVHSILYSPAHPTNFACLETVVTAFSEKCFRIGKVDYALRHVYALVNLCEMAGSATAQIVKAIHDTC